MKKGLILVVIGMLLLQSCKKDDVSQSLDSLILGEWYIDSYASTMQTKYSNNYKQYCQEHNYDSVVFDETTHDRSDIHYAYMDFSSTTVNYYTQFVGGTIREGSVSYRIKDDKLIWGTSIVYSIRIEDEGDFYDQLMTQQICDTTYFYDDDYNEQIAYVKTFTQIWKRFFAHSNPDWAND